jgi:hypothetical protein
VNKPFVRLGRTAGNQLAKSLVAGLLRLLVYGAITSPVPG